jgi:hypothetical protein
MHGISKLCLGRNKGKCGACAGDGGNMPCKFAYGAKPGGKNGELRNIKNGFGGVFIAGGIDVDELSRDD